MNTDNMMGSIGYLASIFIFVIGAVLLALVILYIIDVCQSHDAIRRNYPVIGRFRHIFSTLGEFFRQYFFAMDREEMPFNRAERDWIKRAAKDEDNTVAFGSSKVLTAPGTAIFVNCPFPTLDEDAVEVQTAAHRRSMRNAIQCPVVFQHFCNELWFLVDTCDPSPFSGCKNGGMLDEHWRRRAVIASS